VAQDCGGIDVLVNNAAISFVGTVMDGADEDWMRLFDVNVMGYRRAIRGALPYLRQAEAAAIVNISSCSATSGIPARAAYSATKGAIHSMTLSIAADLVTEGIRVNGVTPGTVDTPFMHKLIENAADPALQRRMFEARQPTGRMVAPEEIALAVAMLASPISRSVTGSFVVVDGGMASLKPLPQNISSHPDLKGV
jgi:2-keto-3-deoxy-L-fuconate dehydrogenase